MRPTRAVLLMSLSVVLSSGSAWAVPAFARQTGLACSQCHTVFPELTPFGRQFKAGGYTLTMTKQITEGGGDKRTSLEMPATVPLGVMAIAGFTSTAKPQQLNAADGAPLALNSDLALPQQFSLFYAGKIAPKLGAFIQLTYEGPGDKLSFDNTDIRFAHTVQVANKPLVLGLTLNNSPTVSDLWNTTPAWSVPFTSSASAPSPGASTFIEGKFAQAVAGLGAYAYFDGLVYAEIDAYRSAPLGVSLPLDASTGATTIISGVMPYWRLAVEKGFGNQSISVGTFGMTGAIWPGGSTTDASGATTFNGLVGSTDTFTDLAVDAQYQYIGETHVFTAMLTYIHEGMTLDASHDLGLADNAAQELHSVKLTASYLYDRMVGARATVATMRGSSDATLYGGQGPRATAVTGEVFVHPWQNAKIGLQYVSYVDFNGASENYDGAGRSAADNNTLYGYVWLAF